MSNESAESLSLPVLPLDAHRGVGRCPRTCRNSSEVMGGGYCRKADSCPDCRSKASREVAEDGYCAGRE